MIDYNSLTLDELFDALVDRDELIALIEKAKREDIGLTGDITTQVCIEPTRQTTAQMRSREAGRLAGMKLMTLIANCYDPSIQTEIVKNDGASLAAGDVVAQFTGPLGSILTAERVLLNFACHLSGIATLTSQFVEATKKTKAKICDTRKTIPGLRHLAKYAVRCGGGYSHRMGLHDAVLIKDNHIAHIKADSLAEALTPVIERTRKHQPAPQFIEVEVDSIEQLKQVLTCDVDMVLLDNMSPEILTKAVSIRDTTNARVQLEASGGVNLQSVVAIAQSGVDRISIGALTHSAPSLDLGLDIYV